MPVKCLHTIRTMLSITQSNKDTWLSKYLPCNRGSGYFHTQTFYIIFGQNIGIEPELGDKIWRGTCKRLANVNIHLYTEPDRCPIRLRIYSIRHIDQYTWGWKVQYLEKKKTHYFCRIEWDLVRCYAPWERKVSFCSIINLSYHGYRAENKKRKVVITEDAKDAGY